MTISITWITIGFELKCLQKRQTTCFPGVVDYSIAFTTVKKNGFCSLLIHTIRMESSEIPKVENTMKTNAMILAISLQKRDGWVDHSTKSQSINFVGISTPIFSSLPISGNYIWNKQYNPCKLVNSAVTMRSQPCQSEFQTFSLVHTFLNEPLSFDGTSRLVYRYNLLVQWNGSDNILRPIVDSIFVSCRMSRVKWLDEWITNKKSTFMIETLEESHAF